MTTKIGAQAPYLDAIPVVTSTTERDARFPTPDTHQRVHNLATDAIERYDGTAWGTELTGVTLNVKTDAATLDGTTDDTAAFAATDAKRAATGTGAVYHPGGTALLSTSLTIGAYTPAPGAIVKPASGQTFTCDLVNAPLSQIFDESLGGACRPRKMSVVYPQWWGAVGDGVHDDTAAVQAALDSAAAFAGLSGGSVVVYFANGSYLCGALTLSTSQVVLMGQSKRGTKLVANGAVQMLTVWKDDATTIGGFRIENLYFEGNSVATGGVLWRRINYSTMYAVEIRNVAGTALELNGVQDASFHTVNIHNSGDYAAQKYALSIHSDLSDFDSNSLDFFGGDIERSLYHGVLVQLANVKFHGTKFHARAMTDVPPATEVDLVHLDSARRTGFYGCQFTRAGHRSIYQYTGTSGQLPDTIVVGCHFNLPTDVAGNPFWHLEVLTGNMVFDDNLFLFGDPADTAYLTAGGDIWVQATAGEVRGLNRHSAGAATPIKDDRPSPSLTPMLGGVAYSGANFKRFIEGSRTGDTAFRAGVGTDGLWVGDGVDVNNSARIYGVAPSVAGMAPGDSFYVEGLYNGGMLRVGSAYIWWDSTNTVPRLKTSAPSSMTDGTPVGKSFLTSISSTPAFVNQTAVVSGTAYLATGTSSTADWKQITPTSTTKVLRSPIGHATANLLGISDTAYWVYVGYITAPITIDKLAAWVTTAGSGTQVAECAIASTPSAPNRGSQTVTVLATQAAGTLTSNGIMRSSAFAYTIPANTHVWAGIRTAMGTTQPTYDALAYDYDEGFVLSTASAGVLTTTTYTGAKISNSNTGQAPALRVETV